jgi:excisionase family DNA binding protein
VGITWVPLGCYVGAPAGSPQIASIPLLAGVSWWALQDSNLRPLPCESAKGSRQTYASVVKSSQSLEMREPVKSDVRHDLAPFFRRLGPNWVQCWSSKHFSAQGSKKALLSVRQVAQLLGVSTATVYRLCERGDLKYFRISNAIRISADDLSAFLGAQCARQ